MKTLNNYINESLTKTQRSIVGSLIVNMFKNSKLTSEQLKTMLMNIDISIIQDIENYISETDKENSMPYLSDKDEFLIKDNYEIIIDKLCKYFLTFIV